MFKFKYMLRYFIYCCLALSMFAMSCFFYRSKTSSVVRKETTQYVIIGCSAAGYNAAKKLAKLDNRARVTCISDESSIAYKKPSFHSFISRKKGHRKLNLVRGNKDRGITIRLGQKATAISRSDKRVLFADGSFLPYDKLLIATGARPLVPEHLSWALLEKGVNFYNSKKDVEDILSHVDQNTKARVLIVGASIRALELADGLKLRHPTIEITLVNRSLRFFGESGDDQLDGLIHRTLRSHNISFLAPATITRLDKQEKGFLTTLDNGQTVSSDVIVFAMGTTPNSELADAAGIHLYGDGSIKVDDNLRTNDPDIFAAGDVVSFLSPVGDGIVRSNKWRSGQKQGEIAAANMIGQERHYRHEPSAFSTSFFGMKAIISGNTRLSPSASSMVDANNSHYYRFVIKEDRLKALLMLWDRRQRRPNISLIRKLLINQNPLNGQDLNVNNPAI